MLISTFYSRTNFIVLPVELEIQSRWNYCNLIKFIQVRMLPIYVYRFAYVFIYLFNINESLKVKYFNISISNHMLLMTILLV